MSGAKIQNMNCKTVYLITHMTYLTEWKSVEMYCQTLLHSCYHASVYSNQTITSTAVISVLRAPVTIESLLCLQYVMTITQ